MAFFLLARGANDEMHLLTPIQLASRQEALTKLSDLTADAAFEYWDAEILVFDTEVGVPVLLMRPSVSASAPEVVIDEADECAQEDEPGEAADVDEPEEVDETAAAEQIDEAAEQVDEADESDEPGEVDEPAVAEDGAKDDAASDADETAVAMLADDSDMDVAADVFSLNAEADSEESPETVSEELPENGDEETLVDDLTEVDPSSDGLKDALLRTATAMESEGIVAPDSIGLDEPESEIADDLMLDEFIAGIALDEVVEPAVDAELEAAVASSGFVDEVVEPASEVEVAAVETPEIAPAADAETAAWPWDVSAVPDPQEGSESPGQVPAAESDFVLSDLEAPGTDTSDMLRGSIDDDTLAATRPVILGAYGDSDPTAEQPAAGAGPEAEYVAPAGFEAAESSAPDNTCSDCVYEETCPNKGQRLPKDCGSFQWK